MVLRVVFKTKQSPRSRLLCIQLRILTLSLHRHQPRSVPAVPIVQVARGELALRDRLLEDGVVLQNIFITGSTKYIYYKGHQETRIKALRLLQKALSTVLHCWLQSYSRQDHPRFGCSEA